MEDYKEKATSQEQSIESSLKTLQKEVEKELQEKESNLDLEDDDILALQGIW